MDGKIPKDPWSLVSGRPDREYRLAGPLAVGAVARDPAPRAFERVLAGAGASLVRDPVDSSVVASVRSRGGRQIDGQAEVGGWPELAPGSPWIDGDGDGIPDSWEARHRLDPRDPADGNSDRDGDGYTELEEWLNGLVEDLPPRR